ncbi:MAG: hypothetical protein LH609_06010, partial [Rudanella sp.]|nr:hypothetical protein [Rudanella sp.]
MFGLDPLSRPVASIEMLLLLSLAAFIGWLIARLILNGRLNGLRADIAERERELANCRQSKVAMATPAAAAHVAPAPITAPVATQTVVVSASVMDKIPVQNFSPPIQVAPLAVPIFDERPAPAVAQGFEAAVLSRIASRANELNFDRIGRASAADADDLKDIVGVG